MNTYMIPREATNENRFLFFTPKAGIFSIVALIIGIIIKAALELTGIPHAKIIGWVICLILVLIGYALGTFKLPESNAFDILKKAGGEPVDVIIRRVINFNKRKKIYIYERGNSEWAKLHKDHYLSYV